MRPNLIVGAMALLLIAAAPEAVAQTSPDMGPAQPDPGAPIPAVTEPAAGFTPSPDAEPRGFDPKGDPFDEIEGADDGVTPDPAEETSPYVEYEPEVEEAAELGDPASFERGEFEDSSTVDISAEVGSGRSRDFGARNRDREDSSERETTATSSVERRLAPRRAVDEEEMADAPTTAEPEKRGADVAESESLKSESSETDGLFNLELWLIGERTSLALAARDKESRAKRSVPRRLLGDFSRELRRKRTREVLGEYRSFRANHPSVDRYASDRALTLLQPKFDRVSLRLYELLRTGRGAVGDAVADRFDFWRSVHAAALRVGDDRVAERALRALDQAGGSHPTIREYIERARA